MSSDTGHTALEGKTETLSRKFCHQSPSISAQYPSRTENSTTKFRKHKKLNAQVVKQHLTFCDIRRSNDKTACHSAPVLVKSVHIVTCNFFTARINTTTYLHPALPSGIFPLGVAAFCMSPSNSMILLEIGAAESGFGAQ